MSYETLLMSCYHNVYTRLSREWSALGMLTHSCPFFRTAKREAPLLLSIETGLLHRGKCKSIFFGEGLESGTNSVSVNKGRLRNGSSVVVFATEPVTYSNWEYRLLDPKKCAFSLNVTLSRIGINVTFLGKKTARRHPCRRNFKINSRP